MKRIKISFTLLVDDENPDCDGFLHYMPEKLTECFCCNEIESCVESDELYDEDVQIRFLKGGIPKIYLQDTHSK